MLSRTADNLFWLARYVERAENTARIVDAANRLAAMPISYAGSSNEWESAVAATGSLGLFKTLGKEATSENVIEFLAFSQENPSSIRSCLERARVNARTVRTALTSEMWEAINGAWLGLKNFRNISHDRLRLNEFLTYVKEASVRFDGSAYRTMLRNDAFFFSGLGTFIERADNTARILDVKYHLLLPEHEAVGGGLDFFQWSSILRSVSANTAYHWVYRESLKPWLVADLLVLNDQLPRSLASCYDHICAFLDELSLAYGRQGPAQRVARSTRNRLQNATIQDVFQGGLHEFLTEFIGENGRLGQAITDQYLV
ncbi:alpha-E domain-containing protein [Kaistia dalseonensis]|uniref:Alpha-E superfamily protein n=1 Tax=Kaistia dalseonensis TaxID=410840 RepID=A0ABU0HBG0_9HYPH|nr:alpha-E domain-containing protein [Kaistia dalseonensis]MCX5496979.1 alpha-E domain-containing protein [Kaistia dalseonensis]MDQ0439605.1 putative alpha-E superfamily protein [Kaistia dalseonensis]